ncbi:ribosome biogenesis regulatory protein-domain-containing protein [Chytriomyces sp. MP71]|nr:ribosome biogenesis regulatory protein-domain-containing protein [Chytriomyces sp. MP71]
MEVDTGILAVFDSAAVPISTSMGAAEVDRILHARTVAAAQTLFDAVFSLPVTDGTLAMLGTPTTKLPRALPVPSESQDTTRWEKFAKEKGIKKRRKDRRVFDEETGRMKVRYGFDEKKDKEAVPEDWLIEVKNSRKSAGYNQGKMEFQKKKERVTKNKSQQRRNQLESSASGLTPKEARKMHLKSTLKDAKVATASIGRFDKTVKGEDQVKFKRAKRKFDDVTGNASNERAKVSKVVASVNKKVNEEGGVIATKVITVNDSFGGIAEIGFDRPFRKSFNLNAVRRHQRKEPKVEKVQSQEGKTNNKYSQYFVILMRGNY